MAHAIPGFWPALVREALEAIVQEARGLEANLYGVGGLARDVLLGKVTPDLDLAVAGHARRIGRTVADRVGCGFGVLHEGPPAIVRLQFRPGPAEGYRIDLADLRGPGIEADLRDRDYSVNAMAFRLAPWLAWGELDLVDPLQGRRDLEQGRLHLAHPQALDADPVRVLRGARFMAALGLQPTPATRGAMARAAAGLASAPGERAGAEVQGLLRVTRDASPWLLLQRTGALFSLIPELRDADGCSQPREHYWDVLRHSIETVVALDPVMMDLAGDQDGAWLAGRLAEPLDGGLVGLDVLRLAALLHDIAKPATRKVEADGLMHFLGHGERGAPVAAAIARRLRYPQRAVSRLAVMVQHHLRPGVLQAAELPTPRAMYRYYRDLEPAGLETLVLNLADHRAVRGPLLEPGPWEEHLRLVWFMAGYERSRRALDAAPAPFLRGDDLMHLFHLPPGPRLGSLLQVLDEAQAAGEITSRDEAIALAGRWLAGERPGEC